MVNGAAVLEYGNHLPSLHELPLGFALRSTIPDKRENDVLVQDSLIPFMPDKNAEAVFNTEHPTSAINQPFSFRQTENGKPLPYSKTAVPL